MNTHIVPSTENLAILGNETGSDWDTTFCGALFCLFYCGDEAWVLVHFFLSSVSGGGGDTKDGFNCIYNGNEGGMKLYFRSRESRE